MQNAFPPMHNCPSPTMWSQEASPGFLISANSRQSHSHGHQTTNAPGLRLIMVLEGEIDCCLDREHFLLSARQPGQSAILIANLHDEVRFERRASCIERESKLCLTISPQWLAQHDLLLPPELGQRPGKAAVHASDWQCSGRLAQLGWQLLRHRTSRPLLDKLEREMLGLQLLAETLACLLPEAQGRSGPHRNSLLRLKDMIDAGAANDWDIGQLAASVHMSSSTLQRHFRREFGCSVMDYLRVARLEQARQALTEGQYSITQIALDAGFSSPANFSTAFRRRFGITPREAMR
ncbi:helix-turn-helix transcriptional regulator [Aquitalea denitrificans]|uniref:helix-turn-helix transcriptional regulator n=1 Tax=Aquitalea denitrificans TaxID=519081 RepID=UPI00135CBA38|nr:AraC family transcriptional regulator [Aquitalea denitrificans]